jgi:hypothetical protein
MAWALRPSSSEGVIGTSWSRLWTKWSRALAYVGWARSNPSGVQTVVDYLTGPITGNGASAVPAGLDHSCGAEHLDSFVIAVSDAPRAVDLNERPGR